MNWFDSIISNVPSSGRKWTGLMTNQYGMLTEWGEYMGKNKQARKNV